MPSDEVAKPNRLCDWAHSRRGVLPLRDGILEVISSLRRGPNRKLQNKLGLSDIPQTKVDPKQWIEQDSSGNELPEDQRNSSDEQAIEYAERQDDFDHEVGPNSASIAGDQPQQIYKPLLQIP